MDASPVNPKSFRISIMGKPFNIKNQFDLVCALGILSILIMMIIPLPTWLLSFLLIVNMAATIAVLLMTTYVRDTLEFSVFPSLLLGLTLFRLALNISSTKLILLQADAGAIVDAFGEVVVRGNIVVGMVVFLILIIVQFIVITKGSERVSEVAARFTLDALPGKQMGVDAELNAGLIDEKQARDRREIIEQEADFYGAMDGASKFVRGDAIASLIIVIVNIVGGVAIGLFQRHMGWMEVLSTYTILTIGDGLVHQIPAIVVSTGTGILVTRASSKSSVGETMVRQLSMSPKAIGIAGGVVGLFGILGFVTGLPPFPFLLVGGLMIGAGISFYQSDMNRQVKEVAPQKMEKPVSTAAPSEDVMPLLSVEPLELEIGYGLLSLVDKAQGGNLLERISLIRRQCARDIGIVVPPVRIRDNGMLINTNYVIKIKGSEVAKGEIMPKHHLAMGSLGKDHKLKGIPTKEPTFGLPALWIRDDQIRGAEREGLTIVDNGAVVAAHLTEVIKSHAHELLGRQEVQSLLSDLKSRGFTAVLEDLIPHVMSMGSVQKILQNLLREKVSIRNLVFILESISDGAVTTKDTDVLTEYVRTALAPQLSQHYRDKNGRLSCVTLSPTLEKKLFDSIQRLDRGARFVFEQAFSDKLVNVFVEKLSSTPGLSMPPVLLCSPMLRLYIRKYLERFITHFVVLSYNEVTSDTKVESLGVVEMPKNISILNAA